MYPLHRIQNKLTPFLWLLFLLLPSCQQKDTPYIKGEYVFRNHDEFFFIPYPPVAQTRTPYPWEERYVAGLPCITKEHFRCKGNPLNPVVVQKKEGKETNYFRDCQGGRGHGLPLRDGKEFVYPCLIELLNYIQEQTQKRVIVTTGHRCPQHNTYNDATPSNWGSKHMIGGEVDFYVEGLEENPQRIVDLIHQYYRAHYPDQKEYTQFHRYEKTDTNVSTHPWYNKEVFVKLFLRGEGRDFDNQHGYPYVGIQVRYDRDLKQKVLFDQKQTQNYLRH